MTISNSTTFHRFLDNYEPNRTGYTYDVGRLRIFAATFAIIVEKDRASIYAATAAGLQNDLDSPTFAREIERAGLDPRTVLPQLVHEAREQAERDVEIDRALSGVRGRSPRARPCIFSVTPSGDLFEVWESHKDTWAQLTHKLEQIRDGADCIWLDGSGVVMRARQQ